MQKVIDWMTNSFAPKVNKVTKNAWVSGIQDAIMAILPLILVGSLISIISILNENFTSFPDFSPINSFTFGIIGMLVSFLIPYFIMEKKKLNNKKIISGAASLALFLMLLVPSFDEAGNVTFVFERFGSAGMFTALIVGLFVSIIMDISSKFSLFKNSTTLPDFVIVWFDSLIPITVIMLFGWLGVYNFNLDIFAIFTSIFEPMVNISQTPAGFILFCFIPVFLYTFGISPWALTPIVYPVWMQAIAENGKLVSAGNSAQFINTYETIFSGWIAIGGIGATLGLAILLLTAKSNRLKAIGKATFGPSILNINEPIVYGAPIVFNPILMIPMWLNGLILPLITYIVLNTGLVTIPSKVFQLWYVPFGISTYLINSDFRGVILVVLIFIISMIIWFPFFKAYDNQEWKKEQSDMEQ